MTISTSTSVFPSAATVHRASVWKLAPIPAVVSEKVTNKSCLVSLMSEKYAFWVNLRPQSDRCRQGEAEVCILYSKTTWSEFQKPSQGFYLAENLRFTPVLYHLPSVGPKQLYTLAHLGCTRESQISHS